MLSAVVELVADLNPTPGGTSNANGYFQISGYNQVEVNGITFFTASTLAYGNELWRTDGTDAGTFRLTDLIPGPTDSGIQALTKLGDLLIFTGRNQFYQNQLWRSDGTVSGTHSVPLPQLTIQNWSAMPVIGDSIYFASNSQLWKSDGTDQGTRPYFDFRQSLSCREFSVGTNGQFYFATSVFDFADDAYRSSLWISDGTETGTRIAKTFEGVSQISDVYVNNGLAFFAVYSGSPGQQIWTSDGTNNGTNLVANVSTWTQMMGTDDRLYFAENIQNASGGLWTYSYADQSLVQLTKYAEDTGQIYISNLVQFKNDIFFLANQQLWRTDGTVNGTTLVALPINNNVASFANINGSLLLSVRNDTGGAELWTTDGTARGTSLLKDLFSGTGQTGDFNQYIYFPMTSFSGTAFFVAGDRAASSPIWVTDGTSSGTRRLANLAPGTGSSNPTSISNVNGELIFVTGRGPFDSDTLHSSHSATHSIVDRGDSSQLGSFDGNVYYIKNSVDVLDESSAFYRWNGRNGEFVLSIPPGFSILSPPLTIANTHYFFGYTYDPVRGHLVFQLRRSINEGADSSLVKEFQRIGVYSLFDNSQSFVHNGLIYFRAENEFGEAQLWRSDGTADGTFILLDSGVYAFQSKTPFIVGSGTDIVVDAGYGLIVTDGSVAGTHTLRDWLPEGTYDRGLAMLPSIYLFLSGSTLWRTDGTKAGTVAVRETGYLFAPAVTVADNCVYFIGETFDRVIDRDFNYTYTRQLTLWRSDRTSAGTQVVFRFDKSINFSKIKDLRTVGEKVIFTILDDRTGYRAIWISDGTEEGTVPLRNNLDGKLILNRDAQFTVYNDGIAFQAATPEFGYELFRIDTTIAVAPPAKISLTDNSVQNELFWPDVPGAIQYDVWLQNLTDKSLQVTRFRANAPHVAISNDLPVGTYRVWVRSMPVLGEPSPWSLPKDFTVAAVPEVSPPGLYTTSTPSFHWTVSANTATYQIWITNRDTNKVSINTTEITATSFVVVKPLVPGNYAVWVRGKRTDQSLTSWSTVQEFNVLAPAVQLTSGTGDLKTSRPTFTWTAVDGATGYNIDVYLVDNSNFNNRLVYSLKNLNGLSATPPSDFPAGKFRVYVTAWKGTRLFSQLNGGDLLWLQLPPTGLRSTTTGFAWDAVPFAGSYTLELRNTNGAFYVPRKNQIGTTIDFANLLPPGRYFLRVFASYPKGSSNWSETFTTERFHPPVTITSSSTATVNATPTISWTATPGASTYEVVVTRPGSLVPVYHRTWIKGTSHRISMPLANGVSQIQVRANYPDGSRSSLSAVQPLQTGIDAALKHTNGTVSWNVVNGAMNYRLWLNYLGPANQRKIVYRLMSLDTAHTPPSTLPKGRYQTWLRPVRVENGQLCHGAWTNIIFDIR